MAKALSLLLVVVLLAGAAPASAQTVGQCGGSFPLFTVAANATDPRLVDVAATLYVYANDLLNVTLGYGPGQYGHDWLLTEPSDMLRPMNFVPTASNQIYYSWHKTGRAVDVPQVGPGLHHAADPANPGYENLYLLGRDGDAVDVSRILMQVGFTRIPSNPSRPEWWHFELRQGWSWQASMLQIYTQAELEAQFPELSWSNIDCHGPDPIERGNASEDLPAFSTIPDLIEYVTFTVPPVSEWWEYSYPPARPGETDFIGWAVYQFAWLAWAVQATVRDLVVVLVALAQIAANFLAGAINAVIGALNGLWRLAIYAWLAARAIFYALWAAMEWARAKLNDLAGYIESWVSMLVALFNGIAQVLAQFLALVLAAVSSVLGLLGWVGGLFLGVIGSIRLAIGGASMPAELGADDEYAIIYQMLRGLLEGLIDSRIGWAVYLLWAFCYIAFFVWAIRYLSKDSA